MGSNLCLLMLTHWACIKVKWFPAAGFEVRAWKQGKVLTMDPSLSCAKPLVCPVQTRECKWNTCRRRKFAARGSCAYTHARVPVLPLSVTNRACHDTTAKKIRLFTFLCKRLSEHLPPGPGRSWTGTILGVHHALPPTNLRAEPGPLWSFPRHWSSVLAGAASR